MSKQQKVVGLKVDLDRLAAWQKAAGGQTVQAWLRGLADHAVALGLSEASGRALTTEEVGALVQGKKILKTGDEWRRQQAAEDTAARTPDSELSQFEREDVPEIVARNRAEDLYAKPFQRSPHCVTRKCIELQAPACDACRMQAADD